MSGDQLLDAEAFERAGVRADEIAITQFWAWYTASHPALAPPVYTPVSPGDEHRAIADEAGFALVAAASRPVKPRRPP